MLGDYVLKFSMCMWINKKESINLDSGLNFDELNLFCFNFENLSFVSL